MRVLFYSIKKFERPYLLEAHKSPDEIVFAEHPLSEATADMAKGFDAISIFAGDDASGPVLKKLSAYAVKFITIRAAGYDNVDLKKAKELGIRVANVPAYSPYAVAEHAVALLLALNRKIVLSDRQVHQHDFRVDNLTGFDLNGKTVGIIGVGKIGSVFAKIMHGFGCRLLGYDKSVNEELISQYGLKYVALPHLCREADIISLHTCLTAETRQLINGDLISQMKKNVMLINTSRGACVDTPAVIDGLQRGSIGYFGTDVYENEKGLFFFDHRNSTIKDDMLRTLLSMPNVLVTPHQAFATKEALQNIALTSFHNINCWSNNKESEFELSA